MVLPLILGLLGSGAAGAGALGAMSPLIAGALGSGLGSAIQTGDIGEGIKTGLISGLTGGIAGSLTGGAAGAAPGLLGQNAAGAAGAAGAGGIGGIGDILKNMPSGMTAVSQPALTSGIMSGGLGQIGSAAGQVPMRELFKQGLNKGVLSGAGLGTALGAAMMDQPKGFEEEPLKQYTARYDPKTRSQYAPPVGYNPGVSPEFGYFGPRKMAEGGMVEFSPTGQSPIAMQGGGLADIAAAAAPQAVPPMNEKAIVEGTIAAVQGQIPEEQAAPILAAFVQTYGEEALRKLVDDVQSGRAPQGGAGAVRGPGDGMSDMIPARMDDGSSDVLLSDGEFVIPADVVSGLGNGSTDAGAAELDRMMGRVREARTGKMEQPKAVAAGGMMPV